MNKIFTFIFTIIISLAFVGIGAYVQFFRGSDYIPTDAVITKIESSLNKHSSNSNNRRNHTVYVEYTVDGQTYSGPSDVWDSTMREGQTITIRYNPDNPAQMLGDPGWLGWFTLGIGSLGVLASFAMLFKKD